MKSIYSLLVDWKQENPDFNFIKYKRNFTLNEVLNEIDAVSKSISYIKSQRLGIHVCSPLDFIILYISCMKNNKIPILFNISWSSAQINYVLEKYEIENIITDWQGRKKFTGKESLYFMEELVNSSRGCGISERLNPDASLESVLFTSGTTGSPKAVSLESENFFNSSISWHNELKFSSQDSYLLCLPMHHISGLSILYRSIFYRFKIEILDSYRDLIDSNSTLVSLVPSIMHRIIENPDYINKLKKFRGIILGGESSDLDMLKKCLKNKLRVFISYGMTETCSGICGFWIDQDPSKLESVGKPFKNIDISIKNKRIMIRSKTNASSYYMGKPISFNFLSSDFGELKESFLYITGNRSSIVTSGGEKINLDYVKSALLEHEFINDVEISYVGSKKWGNSIHVKLISVQSNLSSNEVREWCKNYLPTYAIPRYIEIVT